MLTREDAIKLSWVMCRCDLFPEAEKQIARDLFDYYKELLRSNPKSQAVVPTTGVRLK